MSAPAPMKVLTLNEWQADFIRAKVWAKIRRLDHALSYKQTDEAREKVAEHLADLRSIYEQLRADPDGSGE